MYFGVEIEIDAKVMIYEFKLTNIDSQVQLNDKFTRQ